MQRVVVRCPKCQSAHRLPAGRQGTVRCQTCGESFYADTNQPQNLLQCDICANPDAASRRFSPGEMRVIAANGFGESVKRWAALSPSDRKGKFHLLAFTNNTDWLLCDACVSETRPYSHAANPQGMTPEQADQVHDIGLAPILEAMKGPEASQPSEVYSRFFESLDRRLLDDEAPLFDDEGRRIKQFSPGEMSATESFMKQMLFEERRRFRAHLDLAVDVRLKVLFFLPLRYLMLADKKARLWIFSDAKYFFVNGLFEFVMDDDVDRITPLSWSEYPAASIKSHDWLVADKNWARDRRGEPTRETADKYGRALRQALSAPCNVLSICRADLPTVKPIGWF